jgi:cell division protein YceG involved in septum cleavage
MEAVVDPEPGPWMYFVADEIACDGSHVFAETFEEHQANVNAYRTGTCVP